MTIKIQEGQTLEDIALMHYGAVEGVLKLIDDNRSVIIMGVSHTLGAGDELEIDEDYVLNAEMRDGIAQLGHVFAAGDGPSKKYGGDFNHDFQIDFDNSSEAGPQ